MAAWRVLSFCLLAVCLSLQARSQTTGVFQTSPLGEALLRDPDCGVPLAGIQASIDFSTITVNSVATYTCIRGHVAVAGDHNRTCMDFGRWTGSPLNCTLVNCSSPPLGEFSTVSTSDVFYDGTADYECQNGYNISSGSMISMCQANGTWSESPLNCSIVDCGPPGQQGEGTDVSYDLTTYNSSAIYFCRRGYETRAPVPFLRRCQADGTWSGSFSCSPISCSEPPAGEFSQVHVSSVVYRSIAAYRCQAGYAEVSGSAILTCQANRTWGLPLMCALTPSVTNSAYVFALIAIAAVSILMISALLLYIGILRRRLWWQSAASRIEKGLDVSVIVNAGEVDTSGQANEESSVDACTAGLTANVSTENLPEYQSAIEATTVADSSRSSTVSPSRPSSSGLLAVLQSLPQVTQPTPADASSCDVSSAIPMDRNSAYGITEDARRAEHLDAIHMVHNTAYGLRETDSPPNHYEVASDEHDNSVGNAAQADEVGAFPTEMNSASGLADNVGPGENPDVAHMVRNAAYGLIETNSSPNHYEVGEDEVGEEEEQGDTYDEIPHQLLVRHTQPTPVYDVPTPGVFGTTPDVPDSPHTYDDGSLVYESIRAAQVPLPMSSSDESTSNVQQGQHPVLNESSRQISEDAAELYLTLG